MAHFLDALFGCRHSHHTFPITVRARSRRNSAAALTGTYVACLDCGKEFPYDWQDMKMITSVGAASNQVGALATKAAA
jgi:hypothetical protein